MSTLQDQIYTDTSDMDVSEDESLPAEDVDSVSSFCTAPCTAEDSSLQEMENEVDRLTEQLNGIDRDNSKIIKELEELQKEQKSMRIAFLEIQARSSLGRNARQTRPTPSSVKTTVSVINSPSITNASSAVNAPSAMNVSSVRNVPIVKEPSSKPVSLPVNKPFFSNNVTPINKSVVVPSTATKAERQMELRKAYERLLQDRQHSKKIAHEIKKRMEPLRAQIKKIELDKVDGVNWNADVKKKLANLLDRVSSEEVLHQTQEQNIKGFTAEVNALVEKSRQEGISLHQIKRSILLDNSQERPLKIEVDNSDNRPNKKMKKKQDNDKESIPTNIVTAEQRQERIVEKPQMDQAVSKDQVKEKTFEEPQADKARFQPFSSITNTLGINLKQNDSSHMPISQALCIYESNGGHCNDRNCNASHWRDYNV